MRPPLSILTASLVLAGALHLAPSAYAQGASSEPEAAAFGERVRQYLLDNPEVIMEALQVLEERRRVAEAEQLKRTIVARRDELLYDREAPVGGNPSGNTTLVEFFDYNCPYCKRVAPTVTGLIESDPELRVVYKEIPILGPGSEFAARAALASHEQDLYLRFHEALMNAAGKIGEAEVLAIAREVGLDVERLRRDMDTPAIEAAIERNLQLAGALGISGTPSFVIGDRLVPGAASLAALREMVEAARAQSDEGTE